jgi:hypothetical protein
MIAIRCNILERIKLINTEKKQIYLIFTLLVPIVGKLLKAFLQIKIQNKYQ